ncbi:hypothetical protein PLESTM_000872100 [Pleodorina starrii]|nr:hypothetical protein PLESTM_000872100 [Pleodorina starrii]
MTSVMISRSPGSAAGRASAISSKSAPAAAAVAVSGGCHRQRARSGLSAPRASGAAQSAGFGAPQQQQPQQQQRHVAWRPRNASHRSRGGPVRFREDEKQTEAATRAGAKKRSVVPVILKYGKRCNFGEAFAVVGSVPELGSWDPTRAVKMTWTAGDVWLAHVQLPVDTEVQYKYVRINKDGAVVAWEGVDAANGGAGGPMGNINLHVRPGHRVIWGHGVEVYADLPPEYADFARAPLPSGTSAVVPSTIGGGPAGEAGGGVGVGVGGGSGVLSSVKETARGALAALESALTGGYPLPGRRRESDPWVICCLH